MGTANIGRNCSRRSNPGGVAMDGLGFEENMQRQIADKLFCYNYDLKEKNGTNYLKRFGLFVLGCWWLYFVIQMIRYFIKGVL